VSLLASLHERWVFASRIDTLAALIGAEIASGETLLDVGCGDGTLDRALLALHPWLKLEGVEVLLRGVHPMPVRTFDGEHLPYDDASVDRVMLIDVLHHADEPGKLLAEAVRVARHGVILKDHIVSGPVSRRVLRLMDWVGNARHGVALPYDYWSLAQWREAVAGLGLEPLTWRESVRLYPRPFDWIFGGGLHLFAHLAVPAAPARPGTRA
jgi:SAM-dependent methyltransferase